MCFLCTYTCRAVVSQHLVTVGRKSPRLTGRDLQLWVYLYVAAVSREVELQDEGGDVAAVNQPVQRRPCAHVVHVHRVLHGADRQQPPVGTEAAHRVQSNKHPALSFFTPALALLPDVLDGGAAVSLLRPHLQRIGEEEEELPVLHPHRQHLSVCAVADAASRVADAHFVQQFLTRERRFL